MRKTRVVRWVPDNVWQIKVVILCECPDRVTGIDPTGKLEMGACEIGALAITPDPLANVCIVPVAAQGLYHSKAGLGGAKNRQPAIHSPLYQLTVDA